MAKEIKQRKKRFWTICLALMFMMLQTGAVTVFAEDYEVEMIDAYNGNLGTDFVKTGDNVIFDFRYGYTFDVKFKYYDIDGSTLLYTDIYSYTESVDNVSRKVIAYPGGLLSQEEFKGWEVDSIAGSSGAVQSISFYAVKYDESNISYVLDGGTNAAANPSTYYEGKENIVLADASKANYTFDGWYTDAAFTNRVTSISTDMTGDLTLYAKYTKIKVNGTGSIKVADVNYGKEPTPIIESATNGTAYAKIEYKQKDANDATYTTTKPTQVGNYTARATFAETSEYKTVVTTADFSITYLDAPEKPYTLSGNKGDDGYYKSNVTITPAEGYLISEVLDGAYEDKLVIKKTTGSIKVYLKKASSGEKTSTIDVSEIKIDKTVPAIEYNATDNIIYGETAEISVSDINLKKLMVNGETIEYKSGKATLELTSNNGAEKYEIVAEDKAGNISKANLIIMAEWMKSRDIPVGEKVKLLAEYSYNLGAGKWQVSGDGTTYAGNITFYINSDGEYSFSRIE